MKYSFDWYVAQRVLTNAYSKQDEPQGSSIKKGVKTEAAPTHF